MYIIQRGVVAEGDVVTQCVGRRPLTFAGGVGVALLFPPGSDAILLYALARPLLHKGRVLPSGVQGIGALVVHGWRVHVWEY